jgi:hypothetical protein
VARCPAHASRSHFDGRPFPVFGVSILPFGGETGENNPKTTKNSDFARGRTSEMLNTLPNINRDMYNVTSRVNELRRIL